jgi:hypothetical protein
MTPAGPWSAQDDDATRPKAAGEPPPVPRRQSRIACVTLTAIQNQTICARQSRRVVQPFAAPNRRSGAMAMIATVTLRDCLGRPTGDSKHRRWGHGGPSLPGLSPTREAPMAARPTSATVATVEPVFTEPERLALAGFLAGYTGLTREAYALDLRQYASWCQQNQLPLPGPSRRHRMLRPRPGSPRPRPGHHHPPPVHHRRVLQVRRRRRPARAFTSRSCPPSPLGLRVTRHQHGPQRTRRAAGRRRAR